MQTQKVILIEDRGFHRAYFEEMLRSAERYTLVDRKDRMAEMLDSDQSIKADLILMEAADQAGITNFAAAKIFREKYPHTRMIVIAATAEYTYPERARKCGADSFWYADDTKESLLSVMDSTMQGESVWPEERMQVQVGAACSDQFTEKELQVLQEVVNGCSNKEIGERLNLSYYTIRDYMESLLGKTKLKSRTELAVAAVLSGLVLPEEK